MSDERPTTPTNQADNNDEKVWGNRGKAVVAHAIIHTQEFVLIGHAS